MVKARDRKRPPTGGDDNGYGDVPSGAVGFRGEGREGQAGYGGDTGEFTGGVVDDGHGGPPDDGGFAPPNGHHRSGLGALGDRDASDEPPSRRDESRPLSGSHRGRGPKGYRRRDERIHEDVCERLMHDRFIDASEIEVLVENGEVTLRGHVASRGLKYRVEDLAESVSGVAQVRNELKIADTPRG